MAEEWRPVPGFEGLYSVSNLGRVRSETRMIHHAANDWQPAYSALQRGRLMKPTLQKKGHLNVELRRDGTRLGVGVHALVMLAFVGPRPDGLFVCHRDGQPSRNILSNLRYDTPASNAADRKLHGTERHLTGEASPNAKLTEDMVREIRRSTCSSKAGALQYGISSAQFHRVRIGTSWKQVAS